MLRIRRTDRLGLIAGLTSIVLALLLTLVAYANHGRAFTLDNYHWLRSMVWLLFVIQIGALMSSIAKDRLSSLPALVRLYGGLVFQFALIYYALVLFDFDNNAFVGIHNLHTYKPDTPLAFFTGALKTFLDCLHFSIVTSATVGYGDIYPRDWLARLLTDLHILSATGIAVVGFGRYFAGHGKPSHDDPR
ncbi:potassium channel family protein [Jeongeupia naejangsanensis]|uniref:Two pore domain potassium channel family protein n=1 Tax=Jeongeupia naejangsanensis TaxID=613195 RepID=A0ABS2BJ62_9NEIS|nr:potassium channel family protein [Jeongeupia naejangsanensis]MBM3115657.1 two pore domain potassium channel family protein [Jeongeupia naejangsanensis]